MSDKLQFVALPVLRRQTEVCRTCILLTLSLRVCSNRNGTKMDKSDLIYDWNIVGRTETTNRPLELNDETLRDGLQSPSVIDPPIEKKIEILHLMDSLGIDSADIGLPGAGPRAVADVTRLAKEIVDCKLDIRPNCAARTVLADIEPIVEISEKIGIPIEACTFIGSSP